MVRSPKNTQEANPETLTDFDKCVEAVASQQIPTTKNGQTKEMTAMEAVLQKQFMTAIAGSPHAQNQFLKNVQRTERLKRDIMEKDIEDWMLIKRHQQKIYEVYQEEHGCDPEVYPHPDDIVICYESGVSIDGPIDKKEARKTQDTIAMIDAWLYQHALDWARKGGNEEHKINQGDPIIMANVLNRCLPKRLRRSDDAMIDRMMKLERRPIRALLKETYAAWKAAGCPRRRGAYAPPPEKMMGVLNVSTELTQWYAQNKSDLSGLNGVVKDLIYKHFGIDVKNTT